jgi:hypothetical protein
MSRRKKQKPRSGGNNSNPRSVPNSSATGSTQGSAAGAARPSQNTSHSSENRVIQAENPLTNKGQIPVQSVMVPRRNIFKKQMHQRNTTTVTKNYGLIFYETLQAARSDVAQLESFAKQYDQLNIVIRAEVTADTTDLTQFGKVFTGAAWALIHERRKQDGWYDAPHE